MTSRTWTAALDDLEHQLTAHRVLLSLGTDVSPGAPAWTPPCGLGPLPQGCLLRARTLLQELEEVVEQLEQARVRTRRGLRLHRALPSRAPGEASYVDLRG